MNNKIFECGICFESIDSKQIDNNTELECNHFFHDKCLSKWCLVCKKNDNNPNCPLCRKDISDEYLELLGIQEKSNNDFIFVTNSIHLFQYIIKNKLYTDLEKLQKIKEKHPREFNYIYNMLIRYCLLNSLENIHF